MDVDVQQQQCILIKFLVTEGVSGAEIHCRLLAVFKSEILLRSRVFEWCACICSGHQSVSDDDCAGAAICSNGSLHGLCVLGLSGRYSRQLCDFWIYSECRLLQYTTLRPVTWPAIH